MAITFEWVRRICESGIEIFEDNGSFLLGLSTDPNKEEICKSKIGGVSSHAEKLSDYEEVRKKAEKMIGEAIKGIKEVKEGDFQSLKEVYLKYYGDFLRIHAKSPHAKQLTDSYIKRLLDDEEKKLNDLEIKFNEQNKK